MAGDEYQTLLGSSPRQENASTFSSRRQSMWGIDSAYVMLALGFILSCLLGAAFTVIPPGEIGIVVTLGRISTFSPGAHFRAPIISYLDKMSIKTQLLEQKNVIPTKEGLAVQLDTAVLYRLDVTKAATIYREVGINYAEILIEPEVASTVRGLTSESNAKALYTSGRFELQEAIKEDLQKTLGPRGIVIEQVLLKDIELPRELSKSIELKAKAEQDSARMQFVLAKERQEAERKAIEAKGIADFQDIVSQGISNNLLKWKGIEATEKIAESRNAKIVLMGNSKDALPVLFSAAGGTLDSDEVSEKQN